MAVTNTNNVGNSDKAPQDSFGARVVDSQAKAIYMAIPANTVKNTRLL